MVCFVILHYMALDETILCVESIRDSVEGEKKIIIVDNCSPNGTIKGLEEHYQDAADVDVLETGENLGFAKGNNFGYAYAVREYDPDFVVVMNNDMEMTSTPRRRSITRIRRRARCRQEGIWRRAAGVLRSRITCGF